MLNSSTCPFVVTPLADGRYRFVCPRANCQATFVGPLPRYYHLCGDKDTALGGPCAHRGDVLRTEVCQSCGGRARIKVYACALYGECALAAVPGVANCGSCPDYQNLPP